MTPVTINCRMPRFCRMACRSVAKNAPFPGLSMTASPRLRIQFGDDVVARFAAHQDAAHRAGIADGGGRAPANFLGRRKAAEIRPVSFAGMHHLPAFGAPGSEQSLIRFDGAAKQGHIVAQHFAEAARLQKIALHVDDQQRARRG